MHDMYSQAHQSLCLMLWVGVSKMRTICIPHSQARLKQGVSSAAAAAAAADSKSFSIMPGMHTHCACNLDMRCGAP